MNHISLDSFNDTQVTFSAKTDWELKKAYWLFSLVKRPTVSKIATILMKLFPVKPLIKRTVFEHFCGGETIEESKETLHHLAKYRVKTILDYSVEGIKDETGYDLVMEETLRTIETAKLEEYIPFAVFKVSGIAPVQILEKAQLGGQLNEEEQISYDKAFNRIDRLCKYAAESAVPIFVDAEDSWYQDEIDKIVYQMMGKYNRDNCIVYNTFQMYRKDMIMNLENAIRKARDKNYILGAKLVRGAYLEKERIRAEEMSYDDPICKNKESTDRSFNDGLRLCVENLGLVYLANCSHNEYSNALLTQVMSSAGIDKGERTIYFAQLLGMSDNISFNLAKAGYNVAKYVPYGPVSRVMPYLIRRAEENASVAGQSTRELSLIKKEMERRRLARG